MSTQAWVELGVTNAVHVGHHHAIKCNALGGLLMRRPPPTRERWMTGESDQTDLTGSAVCLH